MSSRPADKIQLARIGVNRNGTVTYDPRELWVANVAPVVAAAREAAAQAVRAARAQRTPPPPPQPPWWQRRWLMFTATGLAIGGAAGAVYAMVQRRSQAEATADELATGTERGPGTRKSTMEAGRERVAGMMSKIRHSREATTEEQPTVGGGPRRNEMPATGTGYGSGQPR